MEVNRKRLTVPRSTGFCGPRASAAGYLFARYPAAETGCSDGAPCNRRADICHLRIRYGNHGEAVVGVDEEGTRADEGIRVQESGI